MSAKVQGQELEKFLELGNASFVPSTEPNRTHT